MAKGEQRGNREAKKPKKEKQKTIAAALSKEGRRLDGWIQDIELVRGTSSIAENTGAPCRLPEHWMVTREGQIAPRSTLLLASA